MCYFGLVGGAIGKSGYGHNISPEIGYYYYKKNILSQNDNVDIFMHSWSVNSEDELIDIYEPKKYIFENQINFNQEVKNILNKKKHKKKNVKCLQLELK